MLVINPNAVDNIKVEPRSSDCRIHQLEVRSLGVQAAPSVE